MAYVTPSTVVAGQTYSAASHNIIVNDIIDHEDRLDTVQNAQYPARNVLINGAMQFSQRGTSVSGISSGQSYYTADRWTPAISANGTWTCAVSADAPTGSGFRNSLRMTCNVSAATAASTYHYLSQRLEGQTLQHIKKGTSSAQPLTLSFWVKGSTTGTYVATLYDWDNTRSVGATYTISAADTWEQKTITFPADTTGALDNDNAVSLDITFILAAGTDRTSGTLNTTWASFVAANYAAGQTVNLAGAASRYLAITGVQLEPGSQDRPFKYVRYDDELRRCQRYYEKSYNLGVTPGTSYTAGLDGVQVSGPTANIDHAFWFRVSKRADPILTFYDAAGSTGVVSYFTGTWSNNGAIAGSRARENYGAIDTNIGSSTIITFQYVANAEL